MVDIYSTSAEKNSYGISAMSGLGSFASSRRSELPDADFSEMATRYASRFLTKAGPEQTLATVGSTDILTSSTATASTIGLMTTIEFADAQADFAVFSGKTPSSYGGRPFDLIIEWNDVDNVGGNVVFDVTVDPIQVGEDVSIQGFGSQVSGTFTSPAVINEIGSDIILMTSASMGGLKANENYVVKISRDGTNVLDTLAGPVGVLSVEIIESAS